MTSTSAAKEVKVLPTFTPYNNNVPAQLFEVVVANRAKIDDAQFKSCFAYIENLKKRYIFPKPARQQSSKSDSFLNVPATRPDATKLTSSDLLYIELLHETLAEIPVFLEYALAVLDYYNEFTYLLDIIITKKKALEQLAKLQKEYALNIFTAKNIPLCDINAYDAKWKNTKLNVYACAQTNIDIIVHMHFANSSGIFAGMYNNISHWYKDRLDNCVKNPLA
jgi:hypothetical protein